jgi:hypothetical protein
MMTGFVLQRAPLWRIAEHYTTTPAWPSGSARDSVTGHGSFPVQRTGADLPADRRRAPKAILQCRQQAIRHSTSGAQTMLTHRRTYWFLSFLLLALLAAGYGLLVRPWHAAWGATPEEQAMALPGDPLGAGAPAVTTRALTIHAPAATIWQWLVQIGQGRGGWYSYDWMENLFAADMHNANAIDPALQQIAVGDPILFTQMGLHATVAAIEPERVLVLDGGWTFYLQPIDEENTRLIVRYFCKDEPTYYFTIFEPAHFLMESGMMLGIKARAEGAL